MKKKVAAYSQTKAWDQATHDKAKLAQLLQSTFSSQVIPAPCQFAGLFRANFPKMKNPILVASTDGIGSKLTLAIQPEHHSQIAVDLVNHCVNDILTMGAQPLFFLDYISFKKWDSKIFKALMQGFKKACLATHCALLGGETAQLPDFFSDVKYDLAGTLIGVVEEKERIHGRKIKPGDVLIGLPSNGLHTNGYTLARKILFRDLKFKLTDRLPDSGETFGYLLRKSHRCYLSDIMTLKKKIKIKGLAHITGGGLIENVSRILPPKTSALINKSSWRPSPLFHFLKQTGKLSEAEAYRTFNMGIGFVIVIAAKDVTKTLTLIKRARAIGKIIKGQNRVSLV